MPSTDAFFPRTARVCSTLSITLALATCSGGTEPEQSSRSLDAGALAARFGPIAEAIQVEALESLRDLAIPMYLSGVEVHALFVQFPGKTLEWNQETARYVESNRTGAPQDGRRVILYATDRATGLPALPLREVGALDLFVHASSQRADSTELRFVVRGPGTSSVIYADFTASTVDWGAMTAIVRGYVANGATRVDFSVPYHVIFQREVYFGGYGGGPSAAFEVVNQSLPFVNDVVFNEDRGNFFDFAATFTVGARMMVSSDSLAANGKLTLYDNGTQGTTLTLRLNGREFGTMETTGNVETYRAPGGQALGVDAQNALRVLAETMFGIGLNIEYPTLVIFFCGC